MDVIRYHIIRPQVQGPSSSSSEQEARVVAIRVQSSGNVGVGGGGVEEGNDGDGSAIVVDQNDVQTIQIPSRCFDHEATPSKSSHAQLYPIDNDAK